MGLVDVPMLLEGPRATRTVRMLVDSGAVWSVLPEEEWKALGLVPQRECDFALADATVIRRNVSECRFTYEGVSATSPVVLGESDDIALLGAATLESLALVLNPFARSLHPMRLLLMTMSRARGREIPHASRG